MKKGFVGTCGLLIQTAFMASCATETDPSSDAPVQVGVEACMAGSDRPPPYGTNGLSPACFWALGSQKALRYLGGRALSDVDGFLVSISTNDVPLACRDVLERAVACALPPGVTLRDPVTSADYQGWWGLAPSWEDGALDVSGRRYVTACLLQSLNATGTHVPILLEGPSPSIAADPDRDALFAIAESTVFGDVFSSSVPLLPGLPLFAAFVCWEDALPQSCGPLGLPLLEQRICDDLPTCGLIPLGPCSTLCAPSGPYWQCPSDLLSPPWKQTVRVRLEAISCQ